MVRFLLMLLLLLLPPGAELAVNNTDEVESLAGTTLGAQFHVTVTPKTMLRKPLPATRGSTNKASQPNPPPTKDGKKQAGPLRDSSVKPDKVQLVHEGTQISESNSTHYLKRNSTSFRSQWHPTKMPVTAKSHLVGDSTQTRPAIRKGPTTPNKTKAIMKSALKSASARYQNPLHLHHKNVTSKPVNGLKDSNVTANITELSTSHKPQRVITTSQRSPFKPGQRGIPLPADKAKRYPSGLQAVTQMSRQLKEKPNNTSVLLNTVVNTNSSSITNSLQHMAHSSNSTFTTGREAILHELNSLNIQDQQINSENVTSVPVVDWHNDVSRTELFGTIRLPVADDSKVMQELKSKVEVRIPDRNVIYNQTKQGGQEIIFSTDPSGIVQEGRVRLQLESTTQASVSGATQSDKLVVTQTERTFDKLTHLSDHSHSHSEAATEDQSQGMTRLDTVPNNEKDLSQMGITENHQIPPNRTHSHKHRHTVLEPLNQEEANTISQHKVIPFHRVTSEEPNRHHPKHLHNHTQSHSHGHHHKHWSDHHARNHISQAPIHLNPHKESELATHPNRSNPPHHHNTGMVPSNHGQASIHSDTHSSTRLLEPQLHLEVPRENQTGSITVEEHSETFGATQAKLITQSALDSHSELTTQAVEHITHNPISLTDSQTTVNKLNNLEQDRQSNASSVLHTKPIAHKHSKSHAKYNLTQAILYNATMVSQLGATQLKVESTMPTRPDTTTLYQLTSTQDDLPTSTLEQQTTNNQSYTTFLSGEELSSSKPGLTSQIQPETITQTLPDIGVETQPPVLTTQAQSDISTQREQGSSTRLLSILATQKTLSFTQDNSPMSITVTVPYLITESQTESRENSPPAFVTLVYYNENDPESLSDSGNTPQQMSQSSTELSIDTGLNITAESTGYTELAKNMTASTNHTKPVTNTESFTWMDLNTAHRTGFSAKPEPITTDSTNHTEPATKSETNSPSRKEPITKIKTDSPVRTETATYGKTESTTKPPFIAKTDVPKPAPSTTKSPTESSTKWEPYTDSNKALRTPAVPSTEDLVGFITTNPSVTSHESKFEIQTSGTVRPEGKTELMLQTERKPTTQMDLVHKTALQPTIDYYHETTTIKGLMQTTPANLGTIGNNEQIVWTVPSWIMNTSGTSMQSLGSQSTNTYITTQRTSLPEHTSVSEPRIVVSGHPWTNGYRSHTPSTTLDSKLAPAWDVELPQNTSKLYPGLSRPHEHVSTVNNYVSEAPSSTTSLTSPRYNFTPQTVGKVMSSQPGQDRIFIVDEQQPVYKVPTINVTYKVDVPRSVLCSEPENCKKHFAEEVASAYKSVAEFDRADVLNVMLAGTALEYKVVFSVRLGSPMSVPQELLLANPSSLFQALAPSVYPILSTIHGTFPADDVSDPCTDWFSCPQGFRCVPQRRLSALCLSPCHSNFCQNDGICIHRKGQEPVCQCPVGRDFWYMGPTCDYRMTHHRLAAIACAVVFCIIICAAAAVFLLVRRFQTQILQQKVAQTQSSYRRFSRFDDVPTHFWCPSQTWLTTSASLNSLDNPAFSSSEEVFPLQALGSCVCGCQDGARNNAPANPPQQPARVPPRLETSCSSVNDLMIDSGKASDVSVCSWPMEPIHWTPFPILHQLSLQSPFHARRPHSYFEGMELVNTERSWTA